MSRLPFVRVLGGTALILAAVVPAPAQSLVRDRATGDYRLTFTVFDTLVINAVVEAADQVEPAVDAVITQVPSGLRYHYTLRNAPSAKRAISTLQMPCSRTDSSMKLAAPRHRVGRRVESDGVSICEYFIALSSEYNLRPGQSLDSLVIVSTYLPTITLAKVHATVRSPEFEYSEAHEALTAEVERLIERAQGEGYLTGGGKSLAVVSPSRNPASMTDPIQGLGVLEAHRAEVCLPGRRWITSAQVCESLRHHISAGRNAALQGAWTRARQHLEAVLSELSANLGGSVSGNAHALLGTNARFIRDRLPGA
jgi:hypothetical protein